MSARDQLNKVRSLYGELTGEEGEVLKRWEASIKKHELYATWMQHPITKLVMQDLTKQHVAMATRLSTEEDMEDVERRSIFKVKAVVLYLLSLGKESDRSVALLETTLTRKAQEMEGYQGSLH